MKFSNQSMDKLLGNRRQARHKSIDSLVLKNCFEDPIIHKEIQGDRVFVPLNLNRIWNGL